MMNQDPRGWSTASIFTPSGIVAVYMEEGDRPITRLDFIHRGRTYTRYFYGKAFSERGLVTVAGRFAREVAEPPK